MADKEITVQKKIDAPAYDELMWPTLKALKMTGRSCTNEELLAKIIEIENYSIEVQNITHSDNRQSKLSYNLAWAKTYLKKVGAIENSSRGVWSLTQIGEKLTREDVRLIPARVRQIDALEKQSRETQNFFETQSASSKETEEMEMPVHWQDRLLSVMRSIPPDAFERLSQRLLREAGFLKVEVTGRSGDGGIDGIGVLRLNLLSFQVLFQCKRYQGSVGSSAIRDFRGAMVGRSDKGLMITTGTFTPEAKREATRDGAPVIDLIDGNQLCELLKQYNLGVKTELVQSMTIESSWFQNL